MTYRPRHAQYDYKLAEHIAIEGPRVECGNPFIAIEGPRVECGNPFIATVWIAVLVDLEAKGVTVIK